MASTNESASSHAAVVGLQWGDEGKGKIVDRLAAEFDVVVRYNGGANAGHTIVAGGRRFALHLVPSGILYPEKLNVIANGVVLDPADLLAEVEQLRAAGVEVGANLRLSDRAHVVLPYHRQADRLLEAALAASRGADQRIGTTGRGIGPCYADKVTRSLAIRVADLYDPAELGERLAWATRVHNAWGTSLAEMAGLPFQPSDARQLAATCRDHAAALAPHVCHTADLLHQAAGDGRRLLLEGANGFMLDVDHGSYPFVTSSSCSALGIHAGAGIPGRWVGRVIGVLKAYTTRVGGGPFPTEQANAAGDRLRERGREYGTTTGRPRRCGWLDLAQAGYAARLSGVTELAVTLLDVLAGFDPLPLAVGYEGDGRPLRHFPAGATTLAQAAPIYEHLPGFSEEIDGCRELRELPAAARGYLDRVGRALGAPVGLIGVGPDRAETIVAR
jgi:adenylosuccinate synthase